MHILCERRTPRSTGRCVIKMVLCCMLQYKPNVGKR